MADWRMFVQTLKKFIHAPWESSSKFAPWSVSVYGLNRVCPSAYAILLRVRTDGAEGDFFCQRSRTDARLRPRKPRARRLPRGHRTRASRHRLVPRSQPEPRRNGNHHNQSTPTPQRSLPCPLIQVCSSTAAR
jgi:hypothetical protein